MQRLCVPIRRHDTLLGYLWVIEGDDPVAGSDLDTLLHAVDTVAVILRRDGLAEGFRRGKARDLLRDLVSPHDQASRERAAVELVEADLFVGSEPVVAAVLTLHGDGQQLTDEELTVLGTQLERISSRFSQRRHLSLVHRGEGVLLASDKDPQLSNRELTLLLAEAVERISAGLPGAEPFAGTGEVVTGLDAVHRSYRQAALAAGLARTMGGLGRVTAFGSLGVYGLLARIPAEELSADSIPSGLLQLLQAGARGEQLACTLEAFLDNAGDIRATAEALFIHRTTLYHRLQRAQQWTDIDLASGTDRLAFHLGLKLARLLGLYRTGSCPR